MNSLQDILDNVCTALLLPLYLIVFILLEMAFLAKDMFGKLA